MARCPQKFVLLAAVSAVFFGGFLVAPASASQRPSAGKKAISAAPVPAAQAATPPQVPPAALTLQQQPAVAPKIDFHGGQLTIVAPNSRLDAILREVQAQTGALIDVPETSERVAGQFGPGAARDVIASLLNGSHFNYILMGSPQDPNSLAKVVLFSKPAGTNTPGGSAQAFNPVQANAMRQNQVVVPSQEAEDAAAETMEEAPEPEPPVEDQASAQQQNGQPAIKTPQQLLQELQRQQQSQQPPSQETAPPEQR
jgi:hypothetical protein